ncbi:DsrE family protein [Microbacterium gorillae]|uniref:DsrE family protein n=1 Tax=Microbacterium gorillae TaxID=1231063 RepID=UPI000693738B|nr:DsrE family protein [Microbacterium gorillae]
MTRAVVIQAQGDDPALVLSAWQHAKNLLVVVGDDVPVEIVVQGAAVSGLTRGAPAAVTLAARRDDMPGVRVLVCRNAMRANDVDEDDLAEGFVPVPAGIAHLVQRQWEGWAYVRSS